MNTHRTKRLGLIVLGAVIGGLAGNGSAQEGPPPAKVMVDDASMAPIETKRRVTGELRAVRRSLLAAEQEGIVEQLDIREGDTVEKGQVIAVLRDDLARIAVIESEAMVESTEGALALEKATLAQVELDLDRVTQLRERGSASQSEYDAARTAVDAGRARVRRAEGDLQSRKAQLTLAKQRVEQLTVRAPYTGRVISKLVELGEWVSRGEGVVQMLSLAEIEAVVDVPEHLFEQLNNAEATVDLRIAAADRSIVQKVTGVVPDVDPLSRLFRVRITLENDDERLRPGMAVIGYVSTGQTEPTLTVHKDAVLRDDAGEYVYFNAGGTAAPARVTSLFAVGDRLAIRSMGLPPGAQVVIEGNERLFPGQPLLIMNGPGGPGGPPPDGGAPGGEQAASEPAADGRGG